MLLNWLSELSHFGTGRLRVACWNIWHNDTPSTIPACMPNPMILRVYWSITTNTQYVRKVADSHRNKSTLHRLSFVWPRNVQPGRAAGSRQRSEMKRQNPTDHVPVDLDTEGQSDLLRDSWTSPSGITPFHLDDCIDKFSSGPFGTGPTPST